jgi:hypothetical protein
VRHPARRWDGSGLWVSLVVLPDVIDGPGAYETRSGETVEVYAVALLPGTQLPKRTVFGCHGTYSCGTVEHWHTTGRLLFAKETANDIVRKVSACS